MSAPPAGVVSIASDVLVHGYPSSFAFWLLIPDDDVATIPYWSALITSFQLQVWPAILNCMHSGASFVTCRIAAGGTAPQRFLEAAPANHGAWTGGQAQSVAAGGKSFLREIVGEVRIVHVQPRHVEEVEPPRPLRIVARRQPGHVVERLAVAGHEIELVPRID